jgi:hypothetical protein
MEVLVRFVEEGADIPDELIRAVTDGRATFLCGAGVSFRVDLPSFKALTERVYARLGESSNDEAAESNAIIRKEYDRALRSLEKRTHRPGTPSRVRGAVADLLVPPTVAFPDHLALLQLSRDGDGRPRLLTTNFDTLFERAALAGGDLVDNEPPGSRGNGGNVATSGNVAMATGDDSEPVTHAMLLAGGMVLLGRRIGDPLDATVERIYRAMRSARGNDATT